MEFVIMWGEIENWNFFRQKNVKTMLKKLFLLSNVGQNAKKRTFFEFVIHFLFRKMRWEMKTMPKKVQKIMFFFTTCPPKIEKVQISSRVTFASIKAKVKKNTKKTWFFYVFLLRFFYFALMLGDRELLGHALWSRMII